ncbi:glycoside hydrolase family 76 protein, partial [Cercospora zeae-maydis SCOH1-5]
LLTASDCAPTQRDVTKANAEAAYTALQGWYNQSTGLWIPSTGWWNSANCMTIISDLAAVDKNVQSSVQRVLSNTYIQAQQYNLQMLKVSGVQGRTFLPQTYYVSHEPFVPQDIARTQGQPRVKATGGFLNDYYDDEGWWALGWIAAYDLTQNGQYLSQAQTIFADMHKVFGKTNCSKNSKATGGIWWDKPHSYVNAIANELFLSIAASLANRVKGGNTNYLAIAKQQWSWFQGTGMINTAFTINDGLDQKTCKNNQGTVWSYNQGVILGGLTELSKATGDKSLITTAQKIADAAIAKLAPNGILTDPCEPNCGADGAQFKGVFVRNLRILQKASPQPRFAKFLDANADSIWRQDRNNRNELSVRWTGPFVAPANASTHSSALDALVASL